MREPRSRSRWVIVAMLAGKGPGVALGMATRTCCSPIYGANDPAPALFTDAMQAGRRFGNLAVVDPFAPAVRAPRAGCAPEAKAKPAGTRRR